MFVPHKLQIAQPYKGFSRAKRLVISSIACIAVAHSLVNCWDLVDYLIERPIWQSVWYAIDRRGSWPEPTISLAVSSALVTLITAAAARSFGDPWASVKVLMCVPLVSYISASVGYAKYEYYLLLHLLHAFFLFVFLVWPQVLRTCLDFLDTGLGTVSFRSFWPKRSHLPVIAGLILFVVFQTDFGLLIQVLFDRGQVGFDMFGRPIFGIKFNLWSVVIAQVFAVLGSLAIWSSRGGARLAALRGILPIALSVWFAQSLVSSYRTSAIFWPLVTAYDQGAFVGYVPGYIAWFVLSSILSILCLTVVDTFMGTRSSSRESRSSVAGNT